MKKTVLAAAGFMLFAACEGQQEAPDPYADLGGAMRVSFVANPEIGDGQCNPNIEFAYRSDAEALGLNVTFLINDDQFAGSGFSLIDRSETGDLDVLTAETPLSLFDPYETACEDTTVKMHELTCRSGEEDIPCPAAAYVGTDMFASFTE